MTNNPAFILKSCTDASKTFVMSLMKEFHQNLHSKLDELLDSSRSNLQQWQLMEVQRALKSAQNVIEQDFLTELDDSFQQFQQGKYTATETADNQKSDFASLSLVANDDLEQNIATSSIIKLVEGQFPEELCLLHVRLCAVIGINLPEEANPIGPAQLSRYFEKTLTPLSLENQITLLCFKIFEKILLAKLGDFYRHLNEILINANILPDISFTEIQKNKLGTTDAAAPINTAKPNQQQFNEEPEQQDPGAASGFAPPAGSPQSQAMGSEVQQTPMQGYIPNPELPSSTYQQQLLNAIQEFQQTGMGRQTTINTDIARSAANNPVNPQLVPGTNAANTPIQQPTSTTTSSVSGPANRNSLLLNAVNTLQSGALSGKHSFKGGAAMKMADALANFKTLTPGNVTPCPVQPTNKVVEALQETLPEGEQNINSNEFNTIDLVGMIFDFMLTDEQLPDSVKSLLSYLHLPYVKLALRDSESFANPDHPARQLLNKLSEAGTLWLDEEGRGQFKVFDEIKETVHKILNDLSEEIKLFETLLDSFDEFVEKVKHRIDQLERLSTQKAEAEQHLQKVKAYVHKRIKARISNEKVPSTIAALLLYPWFDYLTSVMLRFGEKSEQWQQGLQVIDNLLWSIKPKQTEAETNRLNNLKDLLNKQLQKGFEAIGYDQEKGDQLLEKLAELQDQAIEASGSEMIISETDKVEIQEMEQQTQEREQAIEPPDLSTITDDERDLVEKLRMIEFGTWFEFIEDEKDSQKLKVAWFNRETLIYLFVNSAGKQVSKLDALEIARNMIDKTARIIAGSAKPFFERALEAIYNRMAANALNSAPAT